MIAIKTDNIWICSCYISPNRGMELFSQYLNELENFLHPFKNNIITIGKIERTTEEPYLRNGLYNILSYLNNTPTVHRANYRYTIDLTLASSHLARIISDWHLVNVFKESDHCYIYYKLHHDSQIRHSYTTRSKIDPDKFGNIINQYIKTNSERSIKNLGTVIHTAFIQSTNITNGNYRDNGWWSEGKNCLNKSGLPKRLKWQDTIDDIEYDTWGDAFKIITRQLQIKMPRIELSHSEGNSIISSLFPTHIPTIWNKGRRGKFHNVTDKEITMAMRKLNINRAPSPDRIPNEEMKIAATCIHSRSIY